MSKNPFVNCKSRKRRKPRPAVLQPKTRGFCPTTMVRYDDSPNGYKITWVCKMCLKFLLSENAVHNHLKVCNTQSFNRPLPTPQSVEDMRYICESCDRVFTRRVTLHRHIKEHHKPPSISESDEDIFGDNEMMVEEKEVMAEENNIMAEENEIMAEENEMTAEENNIMAEENENMINKIEIVPIVNNEIEIVPIVNNEIEIVPIVNNENKILVEENKILVDEKKTVVEENKILVDESQMLVDESKILADENKMLVDESKILTDENKIMVSKEIELTKEIDIDSEKQNVCENLLT